MTDDNNLHGQPPAAAKSSEASATDGTPRPVRHVERHLLEFLVCPLKKTTLIYDLEQQELISPTAGLAFPIRDGVPLLVESCAREVTDMDRTRLRIK